MLNFILAQIFGGIALVVVSISYFLKNKSTFMIFQVITNFFYAMAFLVVSEYVGAIITIISIFRCLYIYIAEKKQFKYKLHFLPIFVAMYIVVTIVFYTNTFDIMALCSSTLFTIAYVITNLQTMRYVLLIPNSILVAYNILTTTYASAVLDFLEVVVILVAILKFYYQNKQKNNV